ncbi:hypothetical protein Tco_1533751 [Tanacetum coccineum]
MKLSEVKKFCDGTLIKIHENLVDMVKRNKLGTRNKRLKGRDWTDMDVKKSNKMVDKIDKTLKRRDRRLEEYVGGRPKTFNPCTFVMAISVISVSLDSLEESVGKSTRRVILFGTIPTTIPDITPSGVVWKGGRSSFFGRIREQHFQFVIYVVDLLTQEDSTVTYTEVSSPFEDLFDIGYPEVDGLPMMPEDSYAYSRYTQSFVPPTDDVLPAEEQPLPATVSPIADSRSYITEFDPKEDLEEDDKDPEEDPADYPNERDDDEEEEESSKDDANDEEEDEDEDKEEEEEHLAPSDSVPPPACRTTAKMSIQDETPIPFLSAAEVDRFLAISTLPPSPFTSYSSTLPHIPSLPLPVSSPLPVSPPPLPASPTYPLGYRAAMIRLRAESPSTSHPLPLPSHIVLPQTRTFVSMMRVAAPSTYILASRLETPP